MPKAVTEPRQSAEWEKIFAGCTTDLGFIFMIYTINSNNPINESAHEIISQL